MGTSCQYGDEIGTPPAGSFVDVATMGCYACAVDVDGALSCWGCVDALPDPPTGTFSQVTVGGDIACAVRTDGTLACWGASDTWDMEHLPQGSDFTEVRCTGGDNDTMAACAAIEADGHLVLGYSDPNDPVPDSVETTEYSGLTVGNTVCATAADGSKIDCIGNPVYGGHLDWLPPEGDTWAQVSGMRDDYCTLTTSGVIACEGTYMDDVPDAP